MTEQTVSDLAATAERDPKSVDVELLCSFLKSDDAAVRNAAQDCRGTVIGSSEDHEWLVAELRELLDHSGHDLRRSAVEFLKRVVRSRNEDYSILVQEELQEADPRRRGAGIIVFRAAGPGTTVRCLDEVIERLDDEDPRVAALAVGSLVGVARSFPERVVPALPRFDRFLDERWIPDDESRTRMIYDRAGNHGSPGAGKSNSEPLTNTVPWPYSGALDVLSDISKWDPDAVSPLLGSLGSILADRPDGRARYETILALLGRLATKSPADVEQYRDAIEHHGASKEQRRRIAARNVLDTLGDDLERPESVSVPESMASRDLPRTDRMDDLLPRIDQDAILGEIDIEDFLEMFRCRDADVRDDALWGLECGMHGYVQDLHEHAPELLALFDEPDECARKHLGLVVSTPVGAYPEAWFPALETLNDHPDALVRQMSTSKLGSVADSYPALLADATALFEPRLRDEPTVRAAAFSALAPLATYDVDVVSQYVEDAIASLDRSETRLKALKFLESVARRDATVARPTLDPIAILLEDLTRADALSDRDTWEDNSIECADDDRIVKVALEASHWLTKEYPTATERVRPCAERIANGHYYGYEEAEELLVTLDTGT